MPSGDDDEIVARCEPLPFFGELFVGELFFGEFFFAELFVELLAGRVFLECRTRIRFWSSTIVNRTRAELMSIRQCGVMHMGSAVRAHAPHQLARGVPVAGKREQLREDKRRLADVRGYFYPCSTLPELRD